MEFKFSQVNWQHSAYMASLMLVIRKIKRLFCFVLYSNVQIHGGAQNCKMFCSKNRLLKAFVWFIERFGIFYRHAEAFCLDSVSQGVITIHAEQESRFSRFWHSPDEHNACSVYPLKNKVIQYSPKGLSCKGSGVVRAFLPPTASSPKEVVGPVRLCPSWALAIQTAEIHQGQLRRDAKCSERQQIQ